MFEPMDSAVQHGNESFDGLGSKFKKIKRKVVKVATKSTVGKLVTAPLVAPTAFMVKGTTYALARTGAKPFRKLDRAVGRIYRSAEIGGLRRTYGMELAAGAAVGATVLTGGGAAAAIIAATPAAIPLLTGRAASASIEETLAAGLTGAAAGIAAGSAGNAAEDIPDDSALSQAIAMTRGTPMLPAIAQQATVADTDEIPSMPDASGTLITPRDAAQAAVASTAAGVPPGKKVGGGLTLLAPAGVGFLIAGPIGALVGLGAGAMLGKKPGATPVAGFGVLDVGYPRGFADSVKGAQAKLKELGFDPGAIDGIVGPNTKRAVEAFETSWGISHDELWRDFLSSLDVAYAGRAVPAAPPAVPVPISQPAAPVPMSQPAASAVLLPPKAPLKFSMRDPKTIAIAGAVGLGLVYLLMPKSKRR